MKFVKAALGCAAFLAGISLLMFLPAGRWDLPFFWAYIAVITLVLIAALTVVDEDLMKERRNPGPGGQDLTLRRNALIVMTAHFVLAGLDVGRFHWSDTVPQWAQAAGIAGILAAMSLSAWSSRTNRFFSSVVRIQRDRGHHLITGGPYRFIRHPGYAAAISWFAISGIALGSWISVVPALIGGVYLFLRRLRIEETLLFAELEGYREYAQRVPYRLVPGIW